MSSQGALGNVRTALDLLATVPLHTLFVLMQLGTVKCLARFLTAYRPAIRYRPSFSYVIFRWRSDPTRSRSRISGEP